jgi:ribosomal-protein-alanine N-acetyltransferase
MLVRKFVPGDIQAVSRVVEKSLGEKYEPSLYMTIHNLWPEGFLVLEDEGGIIGFVAAVISGPKAARVLMLAVVPQQRGRSGGSMLMDALCSSCIGRGLDTVVLEVRKSNSRARTFYERQGFRVTGEIRCFYTNGEDADKMSRSLLS